MKWFPGVSKTLRLPANQSHRWHFRTAAKPLGNLLTQYSHFVAGTSEAHAGNRTGPKWQWASDKALYYFSTLDSCSGQGPDSTSTRHAAEQDYSPCLYANSCTEESVCTPTLLGPPVPHWHQGWAEPQNIAPITGPVISQGSGKGTGPWGKFWLAATVPIPAFVQRCSNVWR